MEILEKYGQEQLLRFEPELDGFERELLERQIGGIDFSVLDLLKGERKPIVKGKISPIKTLTLDEIREKEAEYRKKGLEEIRAHHCGAVLLAGGMGTRLGSNDPKGMYRIGVNRDLYIFECLINNLMDVVKEAGEYIDLFVMTSDLNYNSTVNFFHEKNYFGYPKEHITFFCQEMAPCVGYDGKVLLEKKGKVALSPNGNGGWFLSMEKSGALKIAKEIGIQWLNVFSVDNVLQRICDPVFIGATILEGKTSGSKVVRKASPDEKVGVMCLEDGKPSIVEYYELTESMMNEKDEKGEPAYNFGVILNYLFNVAELEEMVKTSLPYHIVEKKIPYVNDAGEEVKPDKPNGYKFEQLVLDQVHLAESCLSFEVDRDHDFAPVKNATGVDSVETARALLVKNGVEI